MIFLMLQGFWLDWIGVCTSSFNTAGNKIKGSLLKASKLILFTIRSYKHNHTQDLFRRLELSSIHVMRLKRASLGQ
jgi:hypothetical protein